MKKYWFLFILLSVPFALGEEEERRGVIVDNENDTMTKLIEAEPDLLLIVEACRDQANWRPREDKADCIWRGLDDDEELKNRVVGLMEASGQDGSNRSGQQYNYNLNNFKKKKSKSIEKLEEYLRKRMREALYGATPDMKEVRGVPDHEKFYELYKSQLGRNLITQLSEYCIFSDPRTGRVPFDLSGDGKKIAKFNRDKNLENLGVISANNQSLSFSSFNACIAQVAPECTGSLPASMTDLANPNGPKIPKFESFNSLPPDTRRDHPEYEGDIIHPCELNRYMTGVKKALVQVEGLVETMREAPQSTSLQISNLQNKQDLNTDDIVNIGSKELVEESGYADEAQKEAQTLEECRQNPDGADCAKYLSNTEENQKVEEEFLVRGLALKAKLERDLTGTETEVVEVDQDKLKEYYLENGMSEENFALLLEQARASREVQNGTTVEKYLQDQIRNKYQKERKALQESLNARLDETDVMKGASDPNDPASVAQNTTTKLANIKTRIENSPAELATLYHYSNIVSSFFEVSGGAQATTNTRALAEELQNNYFDGSTPGRGTASDFSQLEGFADPGGSDAGNTSLNANDIDKIQFGIDDRNNP